MLVPQLISGQWVGWSCAYSVTGELLAIPSDMCLPGVSPPAGFREITIESLHELPAPGTGQFVERETAKLMPGQDRMPQVRSGRLAQIHAISTANAAVQDSHYEEDMWVLQTKVWPNAMEQNERWRLAMMLNASAGCLELGLRVWSERSCGPFPISLADSSSGALAAAWDATAARRRCFGDVDTSSVTPSSSSLSLPYPGAGRVELPAVGVTILASRNRVTVATHGAGSTTGTTRGLTVQRRFYPRTGLCCVRSPGVRVSRVSAIRASIREGGRKADEELAEALLSADPSTWAPGFGALPEVIEFQMLRLAKAMQVAEGQTPKVDFTLLLVARRRLQAMEAALESARLIKRINYQLGVATVRAARTGKAYELAALVQWLVFAVKPSTAATVDMEQLRRACDHIEATGSENQRRIARLCGRLSKIKRLAEGSGTEVGEQESAERMYGKVQAELEVRFGEEPKFTMQGWAPE